MKTLLLCGLDRRAILFLMKSKNTILTFFTSVLFLAACTLQPELPGDSTSELSVTSSKPGDTITITSEEGITIIEVDSPSGIGSAQFELVSGTLPQKMVARLHLKGLEEFRLLYADTVIVASASSGSVFNSSNQKILISGKEQPILPGQSLWMKIRIVSDQTSQDIPLEQGYFEITFPQDFIEKAVSSFEIQWVDFFRQ